MVFKVYKSREELAEQFAHFFSELVNGQESTYVALSGGSTPGIVFEVLARDYQKSIYWDRVYFFWGDERCVPPDDEQSNYKMARTALLDKVPVPERNIFRIRGEDQPEEEARQYADTIASHIPLQQDLPCFDLIFLGMGDDGHTASIFPQQMELWDSDAICEVAEHPETGQQRITITGRVINNAKKVVFLVTGKAKAEKLREILREDDSPDRYPAALVGPSSGDVIWYVDREAVSGLLDRESL